MWKYLKFYLVTKKIKSRYEKLSKFLMIIIVRVILVMNLNKIKVNEL